MTTARHTLVDMLPTKLRPPAPSLRAWPHDRLAALISSAADRAKTSGAHRIGVMLDVATDALAALADADRDLEIANISIRLLEQALLAERVRSKQLLAEIGPERFDAPTAIRRPSRPENERPTAVVAAQGDL